MNRRYLGILLLMVFVAGSAAAVEPKTLTLDLASFPVDQVTTTRLAPGDSTFRVELINVIPRFKPYCVDVTIEEVPIPPLVSPFARNEADSRPEGLDAPECADLQKKLADDLKAATSEIGIKAIGDVLPDKCGLRETFKAETTQSVNGGEVFNVRASESITFRISRCAGGAGAPTWTIVRAGTPRGEWRTSYGFFFVPDNDERWYTKETKNDGKPSTFTIEEQADREEFDFVPTVMFTFLPSSQRGQSRVYGLTAGLGYDLEKPFVFGGGSMSYNENVIFSAGVAFHRQSRLIGTYKRGQPVAEVLQPAQLVEDTYGPNFYVGIGFRFGEDIHARRNELAAETAKAQAAAAAAKKQAADAEKEAAVRKAKCEEKEEAAIKAACNGVQTCIDDAPAKAKEKCAVTETERAASEKAEKRRRCDADAEAQKVKALGKCPKTPEDKAKECTDDVTATFTAASLKCIE